MYDEDYKPKTFLKVYLRPGRNGELPNGNYVKHENAIAAYDDDHAMLTIRERIDIGTGDVVAMYSHGSWSHVTYEKV